MKTKVIPMDVFTPSSDDAIMLDTNILIKLFYPIDYESNTQAYENLYVRIKEKRANLLISSIQVSEFINRCIRFQYKLYKDKISNTSLDFKKGYRSTPDYSEKMNSILDIVKDDIMKSFKVISDDFDQMHESNIFLYGFSYDFNDALLVEITRIKNAILVTNDSDFANYSSGLTIVTSNRFLQMMK